MTESTAAKRRLRNVRTGVVTSDRGDKTIRVTCKYSVKHPKYGKFMQRRTVLHAHDENNQASTGDTVEVMACRPISKMKCWRLVRVVNK